MEPNATSAAEVHEVEPLFDLLDDGVRVLGCAPTFDDMFRWILCPVLVVTCIPQHVILPNLHNRLQKLLRQFAGGLEVFLDSEDGEVTIKEFCQGIMRIGPQSAPSTVSWTSFKTLLQRTEGASTCFGRDLHHACQRLRKMRNSTNITKSLPKDIFILGMFRRLE